MLREWGDEDVNYQIDEALTPPARYLRDTWDDDEAWQAFASAMSADRG